MKQMKLENLPSMAEQALGGLTAGPELKARIMEKAGGHPRAWALPRRAVAAVCCAAFALALVVGLPQLSAQRTAPLIDSMAAGSTTRALPDGAQDSALTLQGSSVSISASVPRYRSLWAEGSSGSFPLIGVDGRYYHMMTSPSSVPSSVLGASVGKVTQFTTEPALSAASGAVMSNIAAAGTSVYEIRGMGGTLVAADVNGSCRLFQRVSFNGSARRKGESLSSTLQLSGHIRMMELSGVGTVSDPAQCEKLFSILTKNASYESSGSLNGQQSLLISLDNGLTVQLLVKNDKLAACGVWSCPEFIDAFEKAVQ